MSSSAIYFWTNWKHFIWDRFGSILLLLDEEPSWTGKFCISIYYPRRILSWDDSILNDFEKKRYKRLSQEVGKKCSLGWRVSLFSFQIRIFSGVASIRTIKNKSDTNLDSNTHFIFCSFYVKSEIWTNFDLMYHFRLNCSIS